MFVVKILFIILNFVLFGPTGFAIINGMNVDSSESQSRYTVALQMREVLPDGGNRYYKGTGVIVGSNTILTAGHNFYYLSSPSMGEAIFDVAPLWGDLSDTRQIRIRIKNAIVHPNFRQTANGTEDDLAVLFLESRIPEGYYALPLASVGAQLPIIGESMMVSGYGTSRDMTTAPLSDFRLRNKKIPLGEGNFSSSKFWFDQRDGGICRGDSGAPAVFMSHGVSTIYGVAIHVGYNAQRVSLCLTRGAFANVVYYQNWIRNVLLLLKEHEFDSGPVVVP